MNEKHQQDVGHDVFPHQDLPLGKATSKDPNFGSTQSFPKNTFVFWINWSLSITKPLETMTSIDPKLFFILSSRRLREVMLRSCSAQEAKSANP